MWGGRHAEACSGCAWVSWEETEFFRGFFWKTFLVKQKQGQEDTNPEKLLTFKWSLTTHPSKYFPCTLVNFGKQMLYKMELPNLSKADISRREKTGHKSSPWLKNCAAGCQHPSQHHKCFISIWKPHHPRRSTPEGVVMPLPHSALSARTNAACSLAFLSYPRKKRDRFELHLRQTQTSRLRLLVWDDRPHYCSMRNPAQLSQEMRCTTSAVVGSGLQQ